MACKRETMLKWEKMNIFIIRPFPAYLRCKHKSLAADRVQSAGGAASMNVGSITTSFIVVASPLLLIIKVCVRP